MNKINKIRLNCTKIIISVLIIISVFSILIVFHFQNLAQAEVQSDDSRDREELEQKIKEHTQQLEEINQQMEAINQKLSKTRSERESLENELRSLEDTANQLSLSIKTDEILLDKLNLEVESLNLDINEIEALLVNKKRAVVDIFRRIQRNSDNSFLYLLLKNDSLAESFFEFQALFDLNSQLNVEVNNLKSLKKQMSQKIEELIRKKKETDLHHKNLIYRKELIEEKKEERKFLIEETKNKESEYKLKIEELERKQDEISRTISKIEEELRSNFDPSLLPLKRPGVLAYPVDNPQITQKYGKTRFAERAYRTKFHTGIDLKAPLGTPIFAAEDGKVIAVDNNDKGRLRWQKFQYGKYILIKHSNNLATLYAHLSKQLVKTGDTVKRGDLIGYSGNSGYSTGAHLHFGVYWAPSIIFKVIPPAAGLVPVGVTINPEDYL